MEAVLRRSMSNAHGNQDERIPPLGSVAVVLSTMDQLGRAHLTGPWQKAGAFPAAAAPCSLTYFYSVWSHFPTLL